VYDPDGGRRGRLSRRRGGGGASRLGWAGADGPGLGGGLWGRCKEGRRGGGVQMRGGEGRRAARRQRGGEEAKRDGEVGEDVVVGKLLIILAASLDIGSLP
jgi:hypothetical protein